MAGGLVGHGREMGRQAVSATRSTGPRPSRGEVVFLYLLFLFTFHFSNFAVLFYPYAHLILFYKIYTKSPKLV